MKTNVKHQEKQLSTYGHNKAACLQRGAPIFAIDVLYYTKFYYYILCCTVV